MPDPVKTPMSMHRCGLPDVHDGQAFPTRGAWPGSQLTFALEPGTDDGTCLETFRAVRRAVATWAAAARITFTEVSPLEGPDVVIVCDPAGASAGHVDDAGHRWAIGAAPGAPDVETVALHQLGHILGLPHSEVRGSVMFPAYADDVTTRALGADDLRRIGQLYPPAVLPNGLYTIRQRSTGRYLDARANGDAAVQVVTRPARNSDAQRWQFMKVGTVFVIRQRSTGRYLATHDASGDVRLITQAPGSGAVQPWIAMSDGNDACILRHLDSGRFLDACEAASRDFALIARPAPDHDIPKWGINRAGAHTFTIRQRSTGRCVDACQSAAGDFAVVTRPALDTGTQRWIFAPVGAVCMLVQRSTCQFLDGTGDDPRELPLATRPARSDDAQRWIVMPGGGGSYTIQQLGTGRFVDARESPADDCPVVMRGAAQDEGQRWMFDKV
jgi:matrixin/ricin-type beta-trefoil lectin protein